MDQSEDVPGRQGEGFRLGWAPWQRWRPGGEEGVNGADARRCLAFVPPKGLLAAVRGRTDKTQKIQRASMIHFARSFLASDRPAACIFLLGDQRLPWWCTRRHHLLQGRPQVHGPRGGGHAGRGGGAQGPLAADLPGACGTMNCPTAKNPCHLPQGACGCPLPAFWFVVVWAANTLCKEVPALWRNSDQPPTLTTPHQHTPGGADGALLPAGGRRGGARTPGGAVRHAAAAGGAAVSEGVGAWGVGTKH